MSDKPFTGSRGVAVSSPVEHSAARGRCCVCGYAVALRKDGSAQNHLLYGIGLGGQPVHCLGGGRAPLADNEKPVWESPRG